MNSVQIVDDRSRETSKHAKNGALRVEHKSILSRRSYRSILSYASTGSILSIGARDVF